MVDGVPDVVAPPPGNPRFPLLDALRAIAALSILLGHAVLYSGLQGASVPLPLRPLGTGVTIFFVLSGFLLYRPFVAAHVRGGAGPRPVDYVRRRLLRIFPPLWLALTVLILYPGLGPGTTHHWWVYYGLLQNWVTAPTGLPQAWSLSVELTFYGLLLVLAFAGLWLRGRVSPERPLLAESLVLALVALAWVAFQIHPVTSLATPVYYLDWFLGGMLLAVLSVWVGRRPRPPAAIALVRDHPAICWLAALVAYAVLAFNPGDVTSLPYHVVQGVIGLLIVTPAVFVAQRSTRIHRLLATPVLAWLGLISYGIYLWHATIVERLARTSIGTLPTAARVTVITAAALVITVTCAAISYYALERPLLRRKNGRGRTTPIAPRYGPLPAPGKAADRN